MLQFVQPKLTLPQSTRTPLLDPEKRYYFGSTHIDTGGCSYYRILFLSQLLSQRYMNAAFCDSRLLFSDVAILPHLSSFRLQRACAVRDLKWFHKTLLPAKKAFEIPVVYEIDDILVLEDIPRYNCYRSIFKEGKDSIPCYMNESDAVTVTCAPLADYYSRKFDIPGDKFRIVPNYLPRYFFDTFEEAVVLDRVRSQAGRRKRICFSCGMSHFDVMKTGDGDDFSGILDWVLENRHKYQFIFHGGFPPALEEYAEDFVRIPVGPFLDYPRVRRGIRADLYIQPLKHSEFNECKSPINLLESWAEGTPAFVQGLGNYRQLAPEACFDTAETLDRMVDALFADPDAQFELIRRNYLRMNDLWLDNHLDEWLDVMMKIRN